MSVLFKLFITFLMLLFLTPVYGVATVGKDNHQKIALALMVVFAICTVLSAIGLVWSL